MTRARAQLTAATSCGSDVASARRPARTVTSSAASRSAEATHEVTDQLDRGCVGPLHVIEDRAAQARVVGRAQSCEIRWSAISASHRRRGQSPATVVNRDEASCCP
jgi:hypothetical protein